jgi:hypothetical protein
LRHGPRRHGPGRRGLTGRLQDADGGVPVELAVPGERSDVLVGVPPIWEGWART